MECARDEFFIDFDGNPAPFEHHLGNQGANRCAVRHFVGCAVDENLHGNLLRERDCF